MIWWTAYLLAGAFVGFLAGLLGIGGGMTLVPILAALFAAQGFAPDHVVHMALATSMASVVFTAASSVREHWKLGGVDFDIVKRMTPGVVTGGLLAATASAWIPQRQLALSFSFIVFFGATQILLNRKPKASRTLPGKGALFAVATAIGAISGLVSAGGAFLSIPFMLWCGVPMRMTIGTAALIGWPLALVATVGYVVSGWGNPELPPDAAGFISLTALSGLVCGSIVTAPFGARLAHRLPVATLKRIFALLLYILACKMLWTYW